MPDIERLQNANLTISAHGAPDTPTEHTLKAVRSPEYRKAAEELAAKGGPAFIAPDLRSYMEVQVQDFVAAHPELKPVVDPLVAAIDLQLARIPQGRTATVRAELRLDVTLQSL